MAAGDHGEQSSAVLCLNTTSTTGHSQALTAVGRTLTVCSGDLEPVAAGGESSLGFWGVVLGISVAFIIGKYLTLERARFLIATFLGWLFAAATPSSPTTRRTRDLAGEWLSLALRFLRLYYHDTVIKDLRRYWSALGRKLQNHCWARIYRETRFFAVRVAATRRLWLPKRAVIGRTRR